MNKNIDSSRFFSREKIESLLSAVTGKTLLQVDKAKLFELYAGKEKVTGIAGQIIEASVLGCKLDSKQEADILIDDVPHEIKTTGMVKPKSSDSPYKYECKEPVSVTAVSIPVIVNEQFEDSNFWHKLAHMLWVYYHYNSSIKVKAEGYKNFPILGYQLFEFDIEDQMRLKHDWLLVRDFLILIHKKYETEKERKEQYPRLSHELRNKLLLIDTAPKYPNPPRFRLKKSFATIIAGNLFSKQHLEKLPKPISDYSDVDYKCEQLTKLYSGKSFAEIAQTLNVSLVATNKQDGNSLTAKNFSELVVLKMFEAQAKRLNNIEDFAKIGLIAKSLPLSNNGYPKESMKMFTPDFSEWMAEKSFEESFIREYFAEHQFLLVVYRYTHPDNNNKDPKFIKFVGFKRVYFTDAFIDCDVWNFWNEVRSLIKSNKLKIVKKFKKNGEPMMNQKSKTQMEAPNFPKERFNDIFLRGSATKSEDKYKTLEINGLRMLPQEIWLSKKLTLRLFNDKNV